MSEEEYEEEFDAKVAASSAPKNNPTHQPKPPPPDDTIEKLTSANEALRKQLRMVTHALEAHAGPASSNPLNDDDDDPAARGSSILAQKNTQLKNAQKKIKQYKRENTELQRKLRSMNSSDKLAQLESLSLEKANRISSLIEENRSLVNVQRSMTKQIKLNEDMKEDWPGRLKKSQDELRVLKEKLKRLKKKDEEQEIKLLKQHIQIVDLQKRGKECEKRLQAIGANAEPLPSSEKEQLEQMFSKDIQQLKSKIALMESSNKQAQIRLEKDLKKAKEQNTKEQHKLQQADILLQKKDKEVRLLALQLKKLKRVLKDPSQDKLGKPQAASPSPVPPTSGSGKSASGLPPDASKKHRIQTPAITLPSAVQ